MIALIKLPTQPIRLQDRLHELAWLYDEIASKIENEREDADPEEVQTLASLIPDSDESKNLAKYIRKEIDKTLVRDTTKLDKLTNQIQVLICGFLRLLDVLHSRSEKFKDDVKLALESILNKQYKQIRAIFKKLRLSTPTHGFNVDTKAYQILQKIYTSLKSQYILPKQIITREVLKLPEFKLTKRGEANLQRSNLAETLEFDWFFSGNGFKNLQDAYTNLKDFLSDILSEPEYYDD